MAKLLLLDPDTKLSIAISEFGVLYDLDLNIQESEEDFLKHAQNESFDAYLIYETADSTTLISSLLENNKHPIALFTQKRRNSEEFTALCTQGVDFILEQPLDEKELIALIRHFTGQYTPPELALPPPLVEKYQEKVPEKLENLEQLITVIKKNYKDKEALIALRNAVHKIAGSAAAYGFGEAGVLCKSHELYLYNIYSAEEVTIPKEEIDEVNAKFLRRIRLYFQHVILEDQDAPPVITKNKPGKITPEEKKKTNGLAQAALILVTTDLHLTRIFQQVANEEHLTLTIESDPQHFRDKWLKSDEPIFAVIVEEFYPFTTQTGLNIVEDLRESRKENTPLFGLITQADEIDKRISWLSEGIELVLKKPLSEENIRFALTQLHSKRQLFPIRTLIVDDDPDVGELVKGGLEAMGMEVEYLQDETRILQRLEEFNPAMLLLDINLPRYSGKDLLQTLRSDVRFRNLLIVVVTAIQEDQFDQWAYAENCDEILHKPIDLSKMQSRLTNLLKRHASTSGIEAHLDPHTGLYRRDYFLAKLPDIFKQRSEQQLGFLILKIDLFDSISKLLTPVELHELLILVTDAIKDTYFKWILMGYLGKGQFGLLFENMSGGELETVTENFFLKIRKTVWLSGHEDIKVKMSGGLTLFLAETLSIEKLLEETHTVVDAASKAGSFRVHTNRLTGQEVQSTQKKVILIDDDLDLCQVIEYAFKNHGYEVSVFNTGEDAISYFAKLDKIDENTLLIVDRILPDRDGVTILRMVKEKFPGKVRAIFLSSLSTEKDVLDGLKVGASDYLTKPFSISVLLQKAQILLSQ